MKKKVDALFFTFEDIFNMLSEPIANLLASRQRLHAPYHMQYEVDWIRVDAFWATATEPYSLQNIEHRCKLFQNNEVWPLGHSREWVAH
jgi:hypothetical protein